MFIVYKITNKNNGKSYVGYTGRTIEERWKSHLSSARNGSRFRFHSAIRKHGEEAWEKAIMLETENIKEAKKFEEHFILQNDLMTVGYNAKPGGCGGFIVPDCKIESWKEKISEVVKGAKNPNACNITNDELIALAVDYTKKYGFIPGSDRLRKHGDEKGTPVPKHFTRYRFGGKYINLAKEVERITGLIYNPYHRDQAQRDEYSRMYKGKKKNA